MAHDGRKITYKLHVLQQPNRARACGSGAKSSADRRPVDPPPIVELKVFEGENAETDITASLAANYFLFATLEPARQLAQPRGSGGEERSRPVLTGTAVAGMTYLDRPSPAGYFLFSDLSVRNEGKYRLSFALYEEVKFTKDTDKRPNDNSEPPENPTDHVTHRLEVKSCPFHVFSAKKFPGLVPSTPLSRALADQGCRVRIRRDVRVRRRDNTKTGQKDWDDYEESLAEARGRGSASPAASHYHGFIDTSGRARSSSIASHHSINPALSRRTSMHDLPYQQPPYTPLTPQHEQASSPYGPPPTLSFASSSFVRQQSPMQPPPAYQSTPPPPPSTGPPSGYFPYPVTTSQPQHQQQMSQTSLYDPQAVNTPRMSADYTHQPPMDQSRRSSFSHPAPGQPQRPFSQAHTMQPSPALSSPGAPFRPQQAMLPPSRSQHNGFPNTGPGYMLPPMSCPTEPKYLVATSPVSSMPPALHYLPPTASDMSHKRSYGNVFSDRYMSQPLRDGARPSYNNYAASNSSIISNGSNDLMANDDEDGTDQGDIYEPGLAVRYKRADGSSVVRALPPHC